jgi:preprotein translocase subunit SecG
MFQVLLVIQLIVTLAMIGIILIQRSEADGLGSMGGGGGGLMTSRAQANLLTRTTAILATIFILNSLALTWLTQSDIRERSLAEKLLQQEEQAPLAVPVPDEVAVPAADDVAPLKTEAPTVPKPE